MKFAGEVKWVLLRVCKQYFSCIINIQRIYYQISNHSRLAGQKVLWPHTLALQASQAENFPGNWKIESGKPGRIQISPHFVGTQNSFTAIKSNHKMFNISPMCWVCWLKIVCTLSGGPTLPALKVSLHFEDCRYGFWIWTGFQAWWFILYFILYNPW